MSDKTDVSTQLPELGIEVVGAAVPPTFRFVFIPGGRYDHGFCIYPYGFTRFGADELDKAESFALGEVLAVDDQHAVARFAGGNDADREAARAHLKLWALRDRWELELAAGTHPLTEPVPAVDTAWTPGVCAGCGKNWGTGYASHLKWLREGWQQTWCHDCDGRWSWWRPRGQV